MNVSAIVSCAWVLVLAATPGPATLVAQQTEPIEWADAGSAAPADRRDILDLAKLMGIDQPRRVSSALLYMPLGCESLLVESADQVSGDRRSSQVLIVRRDDWRPCDLHPHGVARQVGHWLAGTEDILRSERWRVQDGDWHRDVHLGKGVSFDDAKSIVLAIHRGVILDRLVAPVSQDTLLVTGPRLDSQDPLTIQAGTKAFEFELQTDTMSGSGSTMKVRIVDGKVELLARGYWIS